MPEEDDCNEYGCQGNSATATRQRVGLGPLIWTRRTVLALGNDPRVRLGYGQQSLQSLEERRERLLRQLGSWRDKARFTIYDVSGTEPAPVGTTALVIVHPRRIAEFYILIGNATHRGRGIGTDAIRFTLDYGFHITFATVYKFDGARSPTLAMSMDSREL